MKNLTSQVINKIKKKIKKEYFKLYINLKYLLKDKNYLLSKKFKNYHLGCGELLVTNFLNLDLYSFGDYVPALPLPKNVTKAPYFLEHDYFILFRKNP